MKIGEIIKELRGEMTQAELARRSGVSFTTISKIETGIYTGTLEIHQKIAKGLGLNLTDLYKGMEKPPLPPYEVNEIRKNPTTDIFYYDKGITSQILIKQLSGRKMLPESLSLEKGKETHLEQKPKGTDHFILILEGVIEIKIDSALIKLIKGQTIYFDASKPHTIKNVSQTPAKCLRITSPSTL